MPIISRRQFIVEGAAVVAAVTALHAPALGETMEVDLALVLAVDISKSVSRDEHRIQLDGYAAAFRDADVVAAITGGACGIIAVTLLEWAHTSQVLQAVDWTLIRDADSAGAFAEKVQAIPYRPGEETSIGGAISYATDLLDRVPCRPLRRVIDVSGDGTSMDTRLLAAARKRSIEAGITINGLPISQDGKRAIVDYYNKRVIGGPRAFLIVADGFASFPQAVRRKLVLEIAGKTPDKTFSLALSATRL